MDHWLTALTALLGLITAAFSLLSAKRAAQAERNSTQNSADIHEVHVSLNSRLTELVETTKNASRAEGVLEGAQTARNEAAAVAALSVGVPRITGEGEPQHRLEIVPVPVKVPDPNPGGKVG